MFKIKGEQIIRSIKRILIGSFLLLVGCSNPISSEDEATLSFDMRLNKDSNGYYHLTLGDTWQTLHRVSGSIRNEGFGVENFWVEWESNLYWYLGDTLGYVVKRGLTDNLEYVSYDTVYVTGFNGMEVPTSNKTSFSNSRGELNNMIAPVQTMVGDTMKLTANWHDGNMDFYIVLE
jgi:hypothetical protein